MTRRDVPWIATIWIVALGLAVTVIASASTTDDPRINLALAAYLTAVVGGLATGFYFFVRQNVHDRRDVLWIAGIWVPLIGVALAAAPEHSYNAGYVVGFIGFFLTGWYLDRRRRERKAIERAQRKLRPCPKCGEYLPREGDKCPECHARSGPWIRQGGLWWALDENGAWQQWNEASERFEPYRAPTAPATDNALEPAVTTQDAKLWR